MFVIYYVTHPPPFDDVIPRPLVLQKYQPLLAVQSDPRALLSPTDSSKSTLYDTDVLPNDFQTVHYR